MFDVIVIGAGHAGIEAAAAASRRGARVALVTLAAANIGVMSCNPSVGGVGKGHIVREIDALDGLMARTADAAAIHHRLLNASKGKAVQGPRVQADRRLFQRATADALRACRTVTMIVGEAMDVIVAGTAVCGVTLAGGEKIEGRTLVLATGTFLGGRLFRGDERLAGGRHGERAATRLADRMRDLGIVTGRLKTGTPPRLDGRTIDWARLCEQPSDSEGWTLSPLSPPRPLPQVACAITRTCAATHDVIRGAMKRSPLFSGAIEGAGPRYCPSIEDKVRRFGDRDGHQIFLEPEGLDEPTVYPNGLSTSLPTDVQEAVIRSIPGLERAGITTPGYAVEYDHIDPHALDHRLALRAWPGVFCAGQINGTTGYEEAAGQGLVAGANAAAAALNADPLRLDRASSYLGVMIDDLVLQGVSEPYRMLTARAEHRLTLRADNAETRLAEAGLAAGLIGEERRRHLDRRRATRRGIDAALARPHTPADLLQRGAIVAQDGVRRTGAEWLRFPAVALTHVAAELAAEPDQLLVEEAVEDARYAPYLDRQREEIAKLRREEALVIPEWLDFGIIPGLSSEMIERLSVSRPPSLAAASRIRGVTPAALTAILLHLSRRAA